MKNKLHKDAPDFIFGYAKRMRGDYTIAENIMWQQLRNRQFHNLKFRRQHPFRKFILDFYCHEKKISIELDGLIHQDIAQLKYDEARTIALAENGITEIRFTNEDIISRKKDTLKILRQFISNL